MIVTFMLNGKSVTVNTDPGRRLVQILRENLQLTGTKAACYRGECGSCTVSLDGELVPSCLVPAFAVRGASVLTVEGFAKNRELAEISRAFDEADYRPCGHCRGARTLAVHALLERTPQPTEPEILEGISGIRCECADVSGLIRAVNRAAFARSRRPQDRKGGRG